MPAEYILTEIDGQKIKLTNLEKPLFGPEGASKAEFIQYLLGAADYMLPHLKGRPLTLIRWPDGVGDKTFYTKNKPSWTPDWMPTTFLPWDEENEYLIANNKAHLTWLANLAALEIHTMNSTLGQITLPDQFIIDLDPPPDISFEIVKELSFDLKKMLESVGYQPFVKLSGGKGIHIVVPLHPRWDYDTVVESIKALMRTYVSEHSNTTLFVHKNKRDQKILLDIYRNHAGNTTIAPYSTRGRVGGPVSLPVTWTHLTEIASADAFTMSKALEYVQKNGDAWAQFRAQAAVLHTHRQTQVAAPQLDVYTAKRDFEKTPEPSGASTGAFDPQSVNDRFVVHMHDATNLHYDLRLGEEGVLKSWAVPKGLPIEKGVKHLAIQTEDHPAKYIDFEGMIPKEEYGGGQMWIFDTGTVQWLKKSPKGYKFQLLGKSINGLFNLYQIKEKEWIIERDESINLEVYSAGIKPMLAESALTLPNDADQWLYEIKWDGIRATFYKRKQEIRLVSRNGRDILEQFPEFQDLKFLRVEYAILDCELVCLDNAGRPVFSDIISRMHRIGKASVAQAAKEKPAYCYAFDCLFLDGKKLVSYPIEQRREWLKAILRTGNHVRISEIFSDGAQLYAAAKAMGLEGIMAKQKQSRYATGNRSGSWLKIKFRETFEAHIIGYTQGKGDRSGWFGALHLAQQTETGEWKYFGKVGTGFDMDMIKEIMPRLTALEQIRKPIKEAVEEEDRTVWVVPQWMCEVTYASFASTGNLREPVFLKMWEA